MGTPSLGGFVALFVTLEGIDGTGKTTLAAAVLQRLQQRDLNPVLTEEPTRTWLGDAVRRGVEEGLDPLAQALLFLADRSLHQAALEGWVSEGRVVLCDRYHDSTLAYQSVALEGRLPDPLAWLRRVSPPMLSPDLTFLLLLDPKEALRRVATARKRAPYEEPAFLQRVQERYAQLATSRRFVTLDATRPPEVLAREAAEAIARRLQR